MVWAWLNWVNATLAIPLAVLGFVIAMAQIAKAKSAAQAAQEAAENASERFKLLSTAGLFPQLASLEAALDTAIDHKSVVLLRHLIQSWKWQASACRQYLDQNNPEHIAAMKKIQRSIVATTALKQELMSLSDTDSHDKWADTTLRTRKIVSEVTGELGALAALQNIDQGLPS